MGCAEHPVWLYLGPYPILYGFQPQCLDGTLACILHGGHTAVCGDCHPLHGTLGLRGVARWSARAAAAPNETEQIGPMVEYHVISAPSARGCGRLVELRR